jgi:hypothetical protein
VVSTTARRHGDARADAETGLLVRHVRAATSPSGVSQQTDYSDYREVASVKMRSSGRTRGWMDVTSCGTDRRAAERQYRRGKVREAGSAGGE